MRYTLLRVFLTLLLSALVILAFTYKGDAAAPYTVNIPVVSMPCPTPAFTYKTGCILVMPKVYGP